MSPTNSEPSAARRPSVIRRVIGWIILAAVIGLAAYAWFNRLSLAADIRLIGYTPPSAIATLADKIQFTPEGQHYFYAMHPVIEGRSTFNADCNSHEAGQEVLGCYTGENIYVYDVTDSRLDGVEEVTAAHETLHAAYARLSNSERNTVDAMIERQYTTLSNNPTFKARFSVYDSLSYADRLNELHSIFGTEVPNLSGELENYYKQYFKDRSILPADYARYQQPFNDLKDQQATLKTQIDQLKTQIDSSTTQYDVDRTQLNNDITAFNQRSSSGGYSDQSQFDSDRSALQARATALQATAATINAQIDQYNTDINQYNSLSIQTQNLQDSLNSNAVQTAPSVE